MISIGHCHQVTLSACGEPLLEHFGLSREPVCVSSFEADSQTQGTQCVSLKSLLCPRFSFASSDVSEGVCRANLWACSHSYYVAISAQLNELNHASLLLRSESLRHLSTASPNRSNTAHKALHKTCILFLHLSACRNPRTKNC